MSQIDIKIMQESDLNEVKTILNHYIEHTHINFETTAYTDDYMQNWFQQFSSNGRQQAYVAKQDNQVIGFAYSQKYRPKAAYITSVETTIYLANAAKGQGLGNRLGQHLLDQLKSQDVNRAYAGVALPNAASVALHKSLGYQQVGSFSQVGRKFDQYYDMILLEYQF